MNTGIDEAFAALDAQPRIVFETSHPNVLAQLAARGLGVAVLPESTARARSAAVRTITITRPQLRGRLAPCLARRGLDQSSSARAYQACPQGFARPVLRPPSGVTVAGGRHTLHV
jgi:DNA-binding transcriptional LysR family regulator